MHYIPQGQQYQFFSIELKNLHPESSNDEIIALLNQLCNLIGFRRTLKNLQKAEIVVASLSDVISLFEHPLILKGM